MCDCNLPRAEMFRAKKKTNWPVCQDHHKLLDRRDIDAVIIATADFQRVLPCIHACQAGKDIYAEKPLTLYVHEGRAWSPPCDDTIAFSRSARNNGRWP